MKISCQIEIYDDMMTMRLILSDDVSIFFYSRLKKEEQQQPFALLSCEIMAIISLCVQSPIIMDVNLLLLLLESF